MNFVGIHLLKDFLEPNYFMTKPDMRDVYCSIPIDKQSRRYLQFIFEGKLCQFKVLVFGFSTEPRISTKVIKPVVAFIRARGILIIIYLDDILLAAPTFEECDRNTLFVIDLLESLGFRISREKSELIPSHHIPFFRIRRGLNSNVYQPSDGRDSFNPVDDNASERQSSNCSSQNVEQIYWYVFRNSPCSFSSASSLQTPTVCEHFSFTEFFKSYRRLRQEDILKRESQGRSGLVGKSPSISLLSTNKFSTPKQGNTFRCFQLWLGDGEHSQGLWSSKEIKWHINLKKLLEGFIGLKLFARCQPCLTHIRLQMDNTTAVPYVNKIEGTVSFDLCMLALGM